MVLLSGVCAEKEGCVLRGDRHPQLESQSLCSADLVKPLELEIATAGEAGGHSLA